MEAVEKATSTEWTGVGPDARGMYHLLSVDDIVVTKNIRKTFDEAQLEELAASLKEYGILQPLVVRRLEGPGRPQYELVAGERRLRAARIAGLEKVPCRVVNLSAKQAAEIQLLENLQRQDLNPLEEAQALADLMTEHGYTQQTLAQKLGKSQPWVAQRLGLLKLPDAVRDAITRGIWSASHGEAVRPFARATTILENVVQKCGEKPIPVSQIREAIEDEIRRKGRRVHTTGWTHDVKEPKFDVGPCQNCDRMVRVSQYYGEGKPKPWCVDVECWESKQKAAKEEMARQAMESAGPGAIPYEALKLVDYRKVFDDEVTCPEGCEHRKHTVKPDLHGAGPEAMDVCLNPDCYHRQLKERNEARMRAMAEEREARLQKYLAAYRATNYSAQLASLPHNLMVSLGLPILLEMAQSEPEVSERIGWEGGMHKWHLTGTTLVEFARVLHEMPKHQFIDLLMETIIKYRLKWQDEIFLLDYMLGKPLPEPENPDEGEDDVA